MRVGLTRRMLVASGLLALVVGAAFAVLILVVADLRGAEQNARHSQDVLVLANRLERQVVDAETGLRGFIITGQESFLEPWRSAQTALPEQAAILAGLVADNPVQQARAHEIAQAATSYIQEYSVPLIEVARRDPAAARTVSVTETGKQRLDSIRAEFDLFLGTETDLAVTRQSRSDADARTATFATAGGFAGSIALIALFAGYLTRAIVKPVRQAAAMAGRLAEGDLSARLPESGPDEIGLLERSFNTMAGSLEQTRQELTASRARIVSAADQARRRIERDLHDGAQQRVVSLVLDLRAAETAVSPDAPELRTQLSAVADGLAGVLDDLRETSRGIHPAILSEGGLAPALKSLARRSVVPVELHVEVPTRLSERVEVAAYYVLSEALTNAAKHARATVVDVTVRARDGNLHMSVRDDGIGGATPGRGSGLVGLADRVQALGGTMSISSPTGEGTTLAVDLPTSGG